MKVVPVEELNQNSFDQVQQGSNEIYSSTAWASAYSQGLRRFAIQADNGEILGGWAAFEKKKWGLKILITPPFASHCGLFFISNKKSVASLQSDLKKCMEAMVAFLNDSGYHYIHLEFPPEFMDFQSFIWKGFNVSTKYTYLLSLESSIENIEAGFDPKLRNKINKGRAANLEVRFEKNVDAAHGLFTSNLQRKGVRWNDSLLKSLMNLSEMHGVTIFENGKASAVAMIGGQNEKCYYLFGSTDKESSNSAAGPLAIHGAIELAKSLGYKKFDFEGSMIPEVEQFFRQFGGVITPVYSIKSKRGLWPRLISFYLK
jgi:hypothetical protein